MQMLGGRSDGGTGGGRRQEPGGVVADTTVSYDEPAIQDDDPF